MLNQCILTGNLGADPELHYYGEGNPMVSFNLAFTSAKKKTSWIKVIAFNRLAEIVDKCLHKGAKVAVIGTLDQQKWETDGVSKTAFQIIANSLEFISTDGRGAEGGVREDEPF